MTVTTKTLVRDASGRAIPAAVSVTVRDGAPSLVVEGLSAERTRHLLGPLSPALRTCGFSMPRGRTEVSIDPLPARAPRSRETESVSLAVALALLAESGQVPADAVEGGTFVGSVSIVGNVSDPGLRFGPPIASLSEARDLPSLGRMPRTVIWSRCCDVVLAGAERDLRRALSERPCDADEDTALRALLMCRYVAAYGRSVAMRDAVLSELAMRGEQPTSAVLTRAIELIARDQADDDVAVLDDATVARGLESARYGTWMALREASNPSLEQTGAHPDRPSTVGSESRSRDEEVAR